MSLNFDKIVNGRQTREERERASQDTQKIIDDVRAGRTSSVSVNDEYINSFARDASSFLSASSSIYKSNTYKNSKNNLDYIRRRREELNRRSQTIRSYLGANKSRLDANTYASISKMLDDYDKGASGVAGAFDEADYQFSKNLDALKKQDDMRAYDLEAGGAELSALEERLERARKADASMADLKSISGTLAPGADALPEYSASEREFAEALGEYGSLKELSKDVSEKRQFHTLAERLQSAEALRDAAITAEDFAEYAAKGASIENPSLSEYEMLGLGGRVLGITEQPENKVTFARSPETKLYAAVYDGYDPMADELWAYQYMTDQEEQIYNYYLAKDKEQGTDQAQAYLDSIAQDLQTRSGQAKADAFDDSFAAELLFGAYSAVKGSGEGFIKAVQSLDEENDYFVTSDDAIAGQIVSESAHARGWLAGTAYDAITNSVAQLPRIALSTIPGVGPVLAKSALFVSAYGNDYAEMINAGFSRDQATTYAGATASAEVFLESFIGGIPGLKGLASGKVTQNALKGIKNGVARFFVDLGLSSASEFLEEGSQAILSDVLQDVLAYEDISVDIGQAVYEGLIGFLSAGVMGGASTGGTNINYVRLGRDILNTENGVQRLKELGMQFSDKTQAGILARNVGESDAYTIGRLFSEIRDQVGADSVEQVRETLLNRGADVNFAGRYADTISSVAEGSPVTRRDLLAVKEDAVASGVLRDALGGDIESVRRSDTLAQLASDVARERQAQKEQRVAARADKRAAKTGQKPKETAPQSATVAATEEVVGQDVEPVEEALNVSLSGKTLDERTGKEIAIKEIANIKTKKDGKRADITFKLDDGSTISAGDVAYSSESEGALYSGIADMNVNAGVANAMVRAFKTASVPVETFLKGAGEAFQYGQYNYSMERGVFSKDLTEYQRRVIYRLGQVYSSQEITRREAEIRAAIKKNKTGERKVGSVHFENKGKHSLTKKQQATIKVMEFLSKVTGFDFYVFESHKTAKGVRVYTDENGVVKKAPNGWFDPKDSSIHIDLFAGNKGTGDIMLFTLAHEITHAIKNESPAQFKELADFLVEQLGTDDMERLVARQIRKAMANNRTISYDEAFEEVVADSMETMLASGNVVEILSELKSRNQSLWEKIKSIVEKLLKEIKSLLKTYKNADPSSVEGYLVSRLKENADVYERLERLFAESVYKAGENYQRSAVTFDADSRSAAPMRSLRTWTESEYVQMRADTAKKLSKDLGVSLAQAYKYVDDINGVAALIADDVVRLDYEPNLDDTATVLKPNSDYKYSIDMSTLCAKRLLATGTFDEIQRRLPNVVFSSEAMVALRKMMQQRGYEVACGICYVESTRRDMGRITQDFIDQYKRSQETGKPIQRLNSSGKLKDLVKTKDGMKTTADKSTDRFYADKDYTPTLADLNTTDIDLVKKDHPLVYEAYLNFMNARGQSKPKLLETRAEYKGEILKVFKQKKTVDARNALGGLRLQSFSDFEVPHMIDMMQVVMDMARVGLKSQAYTKVPAFARVFGNTGVKINLSLIAKGSGLDANGNLIFDDVEGMNHKEAFALRDKFSKNVGTILVGKNFAHIVAAMADPRIDYVIPFHKSSWKESLYEALGLTGYDDYTDTQHERYIDKSRGTAKDFDPSEYWDETKSGDENAQIYLQKCREDGRIPKFPQFQGYTGYWKLLIDFKMYDNDGNYAPQEVVRPQFEMGAAQKILKDYEGGHRSLPVAKDVVSEFVEKHKADERKYSVREDSEGNALTKEQQEFFKDSKARDENGKLLVLYHGSEVGGFTVFSNSYSGEAFWFADKATATSYIDRSAMGDKHWSGKGVTALYSVYLNIKNPLVIDADGSRAVTIPTDIFEADGGRSRVHHIDDIALYAKDNGYDGLIVNNVMDYGMYVEESLGVESDYYLEAGNVYAVFDPAQVKNITNTSPTPDPDIRYQERDFSYNELIKKDDLVGVVVDKTQSIRLVNGKIDLNWLQNLVKSKCKKIQTQAPLPTYFVEVPDIGRNVEITNDGIKHAFYAKGKQKKIDATPKTLIYARIATELPNILSASIEVNRSVRGDNIDVPFSRVMIGTAALEDSSGNIEYYAVRSVVEERKNLNPILVKANILGLLYAANVKKIDNVHGRVAIKNSVALPNNRVYKYKISDFIKDVKKEFDDTFSEDVYASLNMQRKDTEFSENLIFQDRHTGGMSARNLLANALDSVAQTNTEKAKLAEYKRKVGQLNEQEAEVKELDGQISAAVKAKDFQTAKALRLKKRQAENRINTLDKSLLTLQATKPLKDVLARERKASYAKAMQRADAELKKLREEKNARIREITREAAQQHKESRARAAMNRERTEMRHKIRKSIRRLDKLLNRGNKQRNVKQGMQEFVRSAIATAEVFFTDTLTNADLLRNGVGVETTEAETEHMNKALQAMAILDKTDANNQEEREKAQNALAYRMSQLREVFVRERTRLNKATADMALDKLAQEYLDLKDSDEAYIRAAYDEVTYEYLTGLKNEVRGAIIRDMTLDQLTAVYKAYRMVETKVADANKAFTTGRNIDEMSTALIREVSGRRRPKSKAGVVVRNVLNKIGWNYEKPYYALDRAGSETLKALYGALFDSEDIVMRDVIEAAEFRDSVVEKYGFNDWLVNKKIDKVFTDTTGREFQVTLGELMALYAYSRREGAWNHIEYGGFVFGQSALTDENPADAYKLSREKVDELIGNLTADQKRFAEEMQTYLSDVMGAKGNEVSMKLYGIEMFGEKNYFPIHIAGQYMARANESQAKAAAGFSTMTNAGFTKAQNMRATAPFVLESFMDVWSDHVNEMSRYHGTVPALEDIRRVMNYSVYFFNEANSTSAKAALENAYGKEAVEYFDALYREANSGAITDKLQKTSHKLLSKFRKNSVAYSLSVLVQQPASLSRAFAMIPKKYFGVNLGITGVGALPIGIGKAITSKWTKAHGRAYAEMLKFAPGVTLAKEIGGFDTASGSSIRTYLMDTKKTLRQKMKTEPGKGKAGAVMNLVDDNVVANLPNLADKIAWIEIWNACKRETAAKVKSLTPGSEAFYNRVGARFTEVIRATQVYDSIFSKSPLLKSKNLAVQYLVSFMNEPNTTSNMTESAVRDLRNKNILGAARKVSAVVRSVVMTCILKSLIYALRDEDEDQSYIEKYIESLSGSLLDDVTVFNYIPVVRDVWSMAQGYDVERPDMAILSDAISSLVNVANNLGKDTSDMTEEELVEWDKKVTEANWRLVDSIAAFFGIPVKNVRREIDAVIDTAKSSYEGKTSWSGIADALEQSIVDAAPAFAKPEQASPTDKLYEAIVSGDTEYRKRLESQYKDEKALNNAIRKGLRENDPRVKEAAEARFNGDIGQYKKLAKAIMKDGFSLDNVVSAINSELNKLGDDGEETASKEKRLFKAQDFLSAVLDRDTSTASDVKEDMIDKYMDDGKTAEAAEKAFASAVQSDARERFEDGEITEQTAATILEEYCGKDAEEAAQIASEWAFKKSRGYAWDDKEDAYKSGQLSAEQLRRDLVEIGGKTEEEADEQIAVYDFEMEVPGSEVNYSDVEDYETYCKPAGISKSVFYDALVKYKETPGEYDANGDSIPYSKTQKVMPIIDSLPISSAQKTALARCWWAESTVRKYKTW